MKSVMIKLRSISILALALVCALAFAKVPPGRERDPILILCTGQSNFVHRPALKWTPAKNVLSWNYDDVDGHVGTAFVPVPGSTINLPEKIASDIAAANPGRPVYVIGVAIGSQDISHWMADAAAPDMYANIKANVIPALAAIGASKIDALYWYQGETQSASPELYVDNFAAVMSRFKAEPWFPRSTPVVIYDLAPTSISGSIATDAANAALEVAARADPDVRRMVDTGSLGPTYWSDRLHPNGRGFFAMGQMGADAYLRGRSSSRRPTSRNLLLGGGNVEEFTLVSVGRGVVDVSKTADAQTGAHGVDIRIVTADAELPGPAYYGVTTTIGGPDSKSLGFGQVNAKPIVISFRAKGTVPGNYFVTVENDTLDRSYTAPYRIYAAETWEKKFVVIPGDVTGNWPHADVGLRIFWTIASGTAYLFTPDIWLPADVRVGSVSRANGMLRAGGHFTLASVKIEQGLYPSDWRHVSSPTINAMLP